MNENIEQTPKSSEIQQMLEFSRPAENTLPKSMQRNALQTQSSYMRTLFTSMIKVRSTILVLLFIILGSVLFLHFHGKVQVNDDAIEDEGGNAALSHILNENQKSMSNNGDQIPKLRSYIEQKGSARPLKVGHMNIYIRKDAQYHNQQSYKRFRFPVAKFDRHRLPLRGPFLSFTPWIPLYVDRLTKQTLIYSLEGGVYILPPLLNVYGKRFSIAELIASGYASLVSGGSLPSGAINMMQFFRPTPLIGLNIPTINSATNLFDGGIRTNFGKFPVSRRKTTQYNIDSEDETEDEDSYQSETYSYNSYRRNPKKYKSPGNNTCKCTKYENQVYQTSITLPGLQTFYGLLTLLSNCMFFESNNIFDGQNMGELGIDIKFGIHSGSYECLNGNLIRLIDVGYIYKTSAVPALSDNGATAIHNYTLTFSPDKKTCTGQMNFAFFPTGSNPFQNENKATLTGSTDKVTCELLDGKNYQWPT